MEIVFAFFTLMMLGAFASVHTTTKGDEGEFFVNMFSFIGLNSKQYKRLSDVTLHTPTGTTQIDTIIFSKYGIFVIEVKNYKGLVFGSESNKHWLQVLGRKKYPFYNPVMQNNGHIRALSVILDVKYGFHSVVVFSGTARLKVGRIDGVIKKNQFLSYLKSFKKEIFTQSQVDELYNFVDDRRLSRGRATDELHLCNLKRYRGRSFC